MSLKTLLQKIGEDISSIFTKSVNELETVILPAVTSVTNALKELVDADTPDLLGALAGKAGQAIENEVRTALDNIVPKLQMAQTFLSSSSDPSVILANVVKLVNASPADTKTAFWIEFSGLLAKDLAGGITVAQAVQLEQYFYTNYPGSASVAPATPATPAS